MYYWTHHGYGQFLHRVRTRHQAVVGVDRYVDVLCDHLSGVNVVSAWC